MNTRTLRIGLAVSSALLFILCDALSAKWARVEGGRYSLTAVLYVGAMIILATASYLLFGLLTKRVGVSVSSGLVNTSIVIGTILLGIFYFRDHLTVREAIGLMFAIVSVIMLA